MGYPWQTTLGAIFLSGIIFLVLSVVPIGKWIVNAIPRELKIAISAGIGLFLALIALRNAGIVVDSPATLVQLGDLDQPTVLLATGGFFAMVALVRHRRHAGRRRLPRRSARRERPLTFSIATGIGLGFISYAAVKVLSGRLSDASPAIIALALAFVFKFSLL